MKTRVHVQIRIEWNADRENKKDEEVKIMSNMKAEKMTESEVVVMHEKKVAKITSTGIKSCTCKSDFQDKIYGKGMRAKNSTNSGFRCTVCRSTT